MNQNDQRELVEQLAIDILLEIERATSLLSDSDKDSIRLVSIARLLTYLEITLSMIEAVLNAKDVKTRDQSAALAVDMVKRVQELRLKLNDAGLSTSIM